MELTLEGARFSLSATDGLGDPLLGLANLAVALGRPSRVAGAVSLYEGQFEQILRFRLQLDSEVGASEVSVSILDGQRQVLSAAVCSREQIRAAISEALVGFAAGLPRTDRVEGWSEFPRRSLRELQGQAEPDLASIRAPWERLHSAERVQKQLTLETAAQAHPLHGVRARPVAVETSSDRYLLELETGPDAYAVVRLSWRDTPGRSALEPETLLFRTWGDWVRATQASVGSSFAPE